MPEPKYNPQTKKFEFPKPEPGKVAVAADDAYVAIPKATMKILAGYGVADGGTVNAETDKGKDIQRSKLAKIYVLQAIQNFIDARNASAQKS